VRHHKVQIFSLGAPREGTPRDRRRYWVKWLVDGRHKTRSFKTKAEAEALRARLLVEARDGTLFDRETGLPVTWPGADAEVTWWSWSREWLGLKWPQWSGNSRRSGVESLVAFTPHLVTRGASAPDGLKGFLLEAGYVPGRELDGQDKVLRWLQRCSRPLAEITPAVVERALTLATTKRDGSSMAATVVHRRRGILKAALGAAVRRDLLSVNPVDRAEWRLPRKTMEVDVSVVPSMTEAVELVDWCGPRHRCERSRQQPDRVCALQRSLRAGAVGVGYRR
jgi:hypothetical protein